MVWLGWQWRSRAGGLRWLTPAVVASLIVMLPLSLWAVRNWRDFHVVEPLAPKNANDPGEFVSYGFDRWYRTWGVEYVSTLDTYWPYDGSTISIQNLPARAFDSSEQKAETARIFAEYNAEQSASPKVDAEFARLAAERVRAHPLRYFVLMPAARELDMWLRPRTEFMHLPVVWWRFGGHAWGLIAALAYGVLDWVYLALAGLGLWRWRGRINSGVAWAMAGFVGMRCALLLTIDNAEPRYTLECFPVVFVLVVLALAGHAARDVQSD
jgi:hypothetical protein